MMIYLLSARIYYILLQL